MLNITRQVLETLITTERGASVWSIHAHICFHLAVGDSLDAATQAAAKLGFLFGTRGNGIVPLWW